MTTIKLTYDFWWEAIFKVDYAKAAAPCMDSLEFFGDPIERENDSPEETVRCFLKFWSVFLLFESRNHTVKSLIQLTSDTEGLIKLDGSHGIELLSIDTFEVDREDFNIVEQVPQKERKA